MLFKLGFILLFIVSTILCEEESLRRCARAAGSCLLAPETTEGPYYWNSTVRRDITEGKGGVPFRLSITVLDTSTCTPLNNALVDIWHCDAEGIYSHFVAASLGQSNRQTDNSTFFRGQQVTNAQGTAVFDTVYPGWYTGRATHVHVKVHVDASLTNIGQAIYAKGGHVSHTGQIFFNDAVSDEIGKLSPYTSQKVRRVRNNEDGIYRGEGGSSTIIPIQYLAANDVKRGVKGDITLGVNPKAVSTQNGMGGPRPPMRPQRPPNGR
ncbi:unnamed protein product [Adineta steineri]|uniref:Intradiol ring-cleavage dioxygenases domain-containing protein n=2 Tax=Adineta steineri TaxID=433720 RepID=A0A815IXF6_9BILA|nr:unnamed protein product [Adineta steineri]CAF3715920.1 unnamed protein product [Adineta steineri]